DVCTGWKGRLRPAIGIAPDDRAATERVTVFSYREDEIRRIAETWVNIGTLRALIDSPAIVPARGYQIKFFAGVLPNVSHVKLSVRGIKRKPPRIAKAPGENLVSPSACAVKGVGRGRRVEKRRRDCIDVDAKYFTAKLINILREVVRI